MEILKNSLIKMAAGFLYGTGFVLALSLVGYIFFLSESEDESSLYAEFDYVTFDESANLSAIVETENILDSEFTLLGQISNNGETSWKSVSLKADLFDAQGVFLDQCETYNQAILNPDESVYFKMSCGSQCSTVALENYSYYSLAIVDASNVY